MNEIIDLLMKFLRSEFFAILASISSIISLILTFYVFLDVRKIKNYYLFAARVPDLMVKLQESSSNMSDYIKRFDKYALEIEEEVDRSEVLLESLKNKLDGEAKKSIEQLLKDIESYNKRKDKKAVRQIYRNISKVIIRIKEIQEDRKWEV